MVVHLWTSHHIGLARWSCQRCRVGNTRRSRATWTSHVGTVRIGLGLSCRHLCHSPHATASQSGVLVAVAPAVDCALNQTSLAPQTRVQLCQRPTDCIALCLVMQTIALVRVFSAACTRVDTVFRLEVWGQLIDIDRFHVASDRVLHLDAIAGVLESNPLNTVLILAYYEGRCCGNGTRRSVGVDTGSARRTLVHVWCTHRRCLGLLLRRAKT